VHTSSRERTRSGRGDSQTLKAHPTNARLDHDDDFVLVAADSESDDEVGDDFLALGDCSPHVRTAMRDLLRKPPLARCPHDLPPSVRQHLDLVKCRLVSENAARQRSLMRCDFRPAELRIVAEALMRSGGEEMHPNCETRELAAALEECVARLCRRIMRRRLSLHCGSDGIPDPIDASLWIVRALSLPIC